MTLIRTFLAICALAAPVGLVACGEDDAANEDPRAVLDETFQNGLPNSGAFEVAAQLSVEGEESDSFGLNVSGRFQGDPERTGELPQLDLTISSSGDGIEELGGADSRVVVTGDDAYYQIGEEMYSFGPDLFEQWRKGFEKDAGGSITERCGLLLRVLGARDTSGCKIDLQAWLTDVVNEGSEDVGGAETIHVSAAADVERILGDISEIGAALPSTKASPIDPAQLGLLSGLVSEATLDVYSTEDERLLSKVEANVRIDPSALAGADVDIPVEAIDVGLTGEISEINEEQTIEAPEDAKPLDELLGPAASKCLRQNITEPDAIRACLEKKG